MDNIKMTVNHLPSLTWNRLGVNQAAVAAEVKHTTAAAFTAKGTPAVTTKAMKAAEASAYADSLTKGIRRENFIAGKTSIYQNQTFATGLGREFTEYLDQNTDVVLVYSVEAGVHASSPMVLNWDYGKGADNVSQQVIVLGENAEASFVMTSTSEKEAGGIAALGTKVVLGKGAKLHLYKVNLLGRDFLHLDDTGAVIEEGAELDFIQMELGAAKTYAGCYADECGKEAKLSIRTGYALSGDDLLDLNYVTAQFEKKTESVIDVKGVLADRSQKVFRGTIDFRNGSAGSKGDEQEDVLLLDDTVVNKTVPVILCEEEDVDGRHGATIGRLSEDILFYLGTRGIGEKEAERLMLRGRLESIARLIPDLDTVRGIEAAVEAYGDEE
ncbi:MAG: SufD family Fe-S cluster assembly protein [Lachnospiraceae bacterium]|nr:SufD family Fe-S cluster assembly protein [Lachnospiraceae bacterium]